jgi:hypothetical protein
MVAVVATTEEVTTSPLTRVPVTGVTPIFEFAVSTEEIVAVPPEVPPVMVLPTTKGPEAIPV